MGTNLDEAEQLIRRALEVSPQDGYYVDSLGWVYYQRGDYEKAADHLERAVELVGDDPTITEHLADAYRQLQKTQQALRLYNQALQHTEDKDQAARLRGKIEALQAIVHPAQGRGSWSPPGARGGAAIAIAGMLLCSAACSSRPEHRPRHTRHRLPCRRPTISKASCAPAAKPCAA